MGWGTGNIGGGGASLNFKVVGGTTAPSNPKENTIWVETSTAITSYVFSATQPTGSAGMVWITTGTSSTVEFNALKKNTIQVYPTSAKQYISGAWVDKEAKNYQNGAWVEWIAYLYREGTINEKLTGGLSVDGYTWGSTPTTPTFNADHIYCVGIAYQTVGGVGTVNKVDLTGKNWVCVDAVYSNTHADNAIFITDTKATISANFIKKKTCDSVERTVFKCNVSDCDSAYIFISVSLSYNVKIYNIWLE